MSQPTPPVDRSRVLRGGLVGVAIGVLLLALSLFFLLRGFDEDADVLGVLVPLAVGLLSLALGVMALVPLRLGDTVERSPRVIALALRALAGVGVVVTAAAVVRGDLPHTIGAVLPLASVAALLVSAHRFAGQTRSARAASRS